ncbi:unnamed protein product [Schistocephalus solidus]|uniref:Uncharacterized protein n=1 Tax=Schistocephalus solidus TaxID=70667 RepID=A0A183T8T4_SCHSO|nr:unnamed protein product [Schistocephalus solidus]
MQAGLSTLSAIEPTPASDPLRRWHDAEGGGETEIQAAPRLRGLRTLPSPVSGLDIRPRSVNVKQRLKTVLTIIQRTSPLLRHHPVEYTVDATTKLVSFKPN